MKKRVYTGRPVRAKNIQNKNIRAKVKQLNINGIKNK